MPPWIWTAASATRPSISVANSLAIAARSVMRSPRSARDAASYTIKRAAWISVAASASIHWIAWFAPIGLPNCTRVFACSTEASSRRCAAPTACAARPSRPKSRVRSAILKPSPSSPTRCDAGMPSPLTYSCPGVAAGPRLAERICADLLRGEDLREVALAQLVRSTDGDRRAAEASGTADHVPERRVHPRQLLYGHGVAQLPETLTAPPLVVDEIGRAH